MHSGSYTPCPCAQAEASATCWRSSSMSRRAWGRRCPTSWWSSRTAELRTTCCHPPGLHTPSVSPQSSLTQTQLFTLAACQMEQLLKLRKELKFQEKWCCAFRPWYPYVFKKQQLLVRFPCVMQLCKDGRSRMGILWKRGAWKEMTNFVFRVDSNVPF